MKLRIAAALALTAASSLDAQTVASSPSADLSIVAPIDGAWAYSAVAGGSEATFANVRSQPQVTIRCTRATRRVAISKPAAGAAPFLSVWTSAQARNLPASFNPATMRLTAELSAFDPLLDAIAFSRGRVGFGVSGQPPLVVPSWAEATRVIEDCRA